MFNKDKKEISVLEGESKKITPMVMMQMAEAQGAPVEQMERLWELNVKVEAANARKAFFGALAEFKKNPPRVVKDKLNSQYGSDYVGIGNMVTTASESMGQFGLTHSWVFGEGQNGEIICTCFMSHELGHQESVTLTSPIDTSGSKNPLQGRKSTRTYLKLETFEAVTGMVSVSGNIDDDGNSSSGCVSFDQSEEMEKLAKDAGVDKGRFLTYFKCKSFSEMPANQYKNALAAIKKKKESKK
jgi:hypothetical protein